MRKSLDEHEGVRVGDRVRVLSAEQDGDVMEVLAEEDGQVRYVVALIPVATGGAEGMFNRGDLRVTVSRENLEPLADS